MKTVEHLAVLNTLKENLLRIIGSERNSPVNVTTSSPFHMVFISFSNSVERACVVKGKGVTFETAWEDAQDRFQRKLVGGNNDCLWIKADVVTNAQKYPYRKFVELINGTKINYFRQGLAFDHKFNLAFMEQEVNANVFIQQISNQDLPSLSWKNINHYIYQNTGMRLALDDKMIKEVFTFDTRGVFFDGEQYIELEYESLSNGRRSILDLSQEEIFRILQSSSNYLTNEIGDDGRYNYGHFPCFDKPIEHYNMLRHASTTYSLIETFEITKDIGMLSSIQRALSFIVNHGIRNLTIDNKLLSFVIEPSEDNCIKLGANAAAILAISKYINVTNDKAYSSIIEQLADGILYMQNEEGSFNHVLNYPDLTLKESFRIIYYDGEAAFALMRAYEVIKKEAWLDAVKKSFEYFLKNDYHEHHDHWLSYCSFELYQVTNDLRILDFNLKNAEGIFEFALNRETTYPTLLELLMATSKAVVYATANNQHNERLKVFDSDKLYQVIEHRVQNQLNGLMFPEVAMYFKAPSKILWGFFIRHHSFRIRIDDVEHNLSGYCSYYNFKSK